MFDTLTTTLSERVIAASMMLAATSAGYGILAVMATVLAAIILFVVRWFETYAGSKESRPSDST